MVEYRDQRLDAVFGALSHPVRRGILDQLRPGENKVTDLAAPFAMSLAAVSKHIRVLEQAGLVRRTVRGREHHLALEASPLMRAESWVETYRLFWDSRLDLLATKLRRRRRL